MIKRHVVKSCCRAKSYIFEIDKPIKKSHLQFFKNTGYIAPPNFTTSGIFYVRGNGIVATSPFGARKINVKCSGNNCGVILNNFEQILQQAILS